jgi:hypothetical protein
MGEYGEGTRGESGGAWGSGSLREVENLGPCR